jgi:predicted RNA-binding protein with PUA-like domain
MACWLVKSDPETYAWADLARERRAVWDGVANALALRHLSGMRPGDDCLVYESGAVRAVVGHARVVSEPYPDPHADDPRRLVVELEAVAPLPSPVALATIKADPVFAEFSLVRHSRLSVMPVAAPIRRRLLVLAGGGAGRR